MKTLIVIEATGKRDTLAELLRCSSFPHVSHPVVVLATKGHLAQLDEGKPAIASDGTMTPLAVHPRRRTEVAAISRAAEQANTIIIATDDDDEGYVIARDVARLALKGKEFWRCKLRALDRQSLYDALASADCMTVDLANRAAMAGDTRRLVDYAIGYGLSAIDGQHRIPVGRVISSALISISECSPALGVQTFIAPAQDGGAPFTAFVRTTKQLQHRPIPALATESAQECIGHVTAWNYADAIESAALQTKRPIVEVNSSLQRAYERGLVSYPRTLSRSISPSGLQACKAIADLHGASFTATSPGHSRGAHEAIRPTSTASLQRVLLHDLDATVALLVARQAIRAGQSYLVETANHAQVPSELIQLGACFRRVTLHGFLGWKEQKSPPTEWLAWPSDVALLNYLSAQDLGRPGTWIKHIEKLMKRGILTPLLTLNRIGALYADHAIEQGLTQSTSRELEIAISSRTATAQDAAQAALSVLEEALPESSFQSVYNALTVAGTNVEPTPLHNPEEESSPGPSSW